MRFLLLACLAPLLSGCFVLSVFDDTPKTPFSDTVQAGPDGLDCALAYAAGRGYAVAAAEAGIFFRAERRGRVRGTIVRVDLLSASYAEGRLGVVVDRRLDEVDDGTSRPFAPDPLAVDEARALLERCGQ